MSMVSRDDPLFPSLEPYAQGMLEVGDSHCLHFEQCGNPAGLPVVVLHGGPGSGCVPQQRRFFDPDRYRVVLFDQRGCGRSTPRGTIADNTTDHLVADIERLRGYLGIDRWLVFGGSWGSSLAIAYAAVHGAACLGLILRGIFLTGRADLDWFFRGSAQFLPEDWARFAAIAPGRRLLDHCAEVLAAGPEPGDAAFAAARAWAAYEAAALSFGLERPQPASAIDFADASRLVDKYRIQSHYLARQCFLGEARLLGLARRCSGLPTAILHGRRDLVCRPLNAWRLHRHMPQSRLRMIENSGHNPFEPAMGAALVAATGHFAQHLGFTHWP